MANPNQLIDFLVKLTGTSGHALRHSVKDDKKGITTNSLFFKPYRSVGDFAMRTITPITAPATFAIAAITAAAVGLYEGLKALYYTCAGDKQLAGETAGNFIGCAIVTIAFLLAALFSPAVNFVDGIGGGINSLRGQAAEPTEQPAFAQ